MPAMQHAARVGIMPTLNRKIAMAAATERTRAHGSTVTKFGASNDNGKAWTGTVSRNTVWIAKYRTGEVHEFYGKSTGHHGGIHGRRAFPMPMQLGRDVAGEVAAVGASVTTLAPGDRVLGMTNPENTLSLASIRGLGNLSGG